MAQEAKWYVVHTYSGYENKVKVNLEKTIENNNLQHLFHDIRIPMEEVVEIKDGEEKSSMKKVLPGYVMIKMVMTDFSWYIVRNTRGCTGFVGPGSKPVPLTDSEVEKLGFEQKVYSVDYEVGDCVKILNPSFRDFIGFVEEINMETKKVKVSVSMFGRDTELELGFDEIEKDED
ncbi:MAG: transcription termination/antitermination protein NusG [Clostridia bacterium]|nr:transcription termination/antitermination protein NusG [Clostridia bacterium]